MLLQRERQKFLAEEWPRVGATIKRLGFKPEQVFANLERYGNTSCASIPICLEEAWASGRLQKGDLLLMTGFGAGLRLARRPGTARRCPRSPARRPHRRGGGRRTRPGR